MYLLCRTRQEILPEVSQLSCQPVWIYGFALIPEMVRKHSPSLLMTICAQVQAALAVDKVISDSNLGHSDVVIASGPR